MSIRSKITVFVLLLGLSEAILLGVIGYSSITAVAENAGELRRIITALEGTRDLSISLAQLSDPADWITEDAQGIARDRFLSQLDDINQRVGSCAATTCHGFEKRPPRMAREIQDELWKIRTSGLAFYGDDVPGQPHSLKEWTAGVGVPARRLTGATNKMSDSLTTMARELEDASREVERSSLLMVAFMTLLCIFAAVILSYPIARGIARPLEELAVQSGQIAKGNLEVRAQEQGPREVAVLGQAFNRMLGDLARHREAQLAYQTQLEHDVQQSVHELRGKDEEIKRNERLVGIGLVAGAVAHDLNNPLTNISLNTEALLDAVGGEKGLLKDLADDIRADALRCREIATDIRAMIREKDLEFVRSTAAPLIKEAVRLVRHKWEPRHITIELNLSPNGCECLCSPSRILQMLINLIANAIDATPDGGVVQVRTWSDEHRSYVEVEDHGPGIAKELRDTLFKPLFTQKADGTGLGLAISRRIAEQHGGVIEYETRTAEDADPRGTGTTFRVVMPLSSENKKGGDGT